MKLGPELWECARIALSALRANRLRSSLTTLGVVIGVLAVTLMGTAITGLSRAFTRSISALGTDVLYVDRFPWFTDRSDWWIYRNRPKITLSQERKLARQMTLAKAVSVWTYSTQPVQHEDRTGGNVTVIGTNAQFVQTEGVTLWRGRFLSPREVASGRPVCVIGYNIAKNLFPNESAVGRHIKIGGFPFIVVGVLAKRGRFLGLFSLDEQIQVPILRFISLFQAHPDVQINIKVIDIKHLDDAKEEVRWIMRRLRHLRPGDPDNFAINQQSMFLKTFHKVGGTIALAGLIITGLSLFVGGIGIMNVMYVSVAERTREIGVRKALGARRRTILLQFLFEAAGLSLLGGLIALAIALPTTLGMRYFFPATLSVPVVGAALLVSIVTGLISGFMPAYRASRLRPVEALRNE